VHFRSSFHVISRVILFAWTKPLEFNIVCGLMVLWRASAPRAARKKSQCPVVNPLLPNLVYNFENSFPASCCVASRTLANGGTLYACRCMHAPTGTCCIVRHSEKSCFEACLRSQQFFALLSPARRSPTLIFGVHVDLMEVLCSHAALNRIMPSSGVIRD
jgi:hypothetical protein